MEPCHGHPWLRSPTKSRIRVRSYSEKWWSGSRRVYVSSIFRPLLTGAGRAQRRQDCVRDAAAPSNRPSSRPSISALGSRGLRWTRLSSGGRRSRGDEHLLERQLRERVGQALGVDPAAMLQRPRRLAVAEHVAGLRSRRRHEAQQARASNTTSLLTSRRSCLDAIARANRHQRRSDDVAGHTHRRTQPLQRVAAGPGLIAAAGPSGPWHSGIPGGDMAVDGARLRAGELARPARALAAVRHKSRPGNAQNLRTGY